MQATPSLTYRDYFPTEAEAKAFCATLIFGGVIQLVNGWYHVWQQNQSSNPTPHKPKQ